MKVTVKKKFKDKYTREIYAPGAVLDLTEERAAEIMQHLEGYIEVDDNQVAEGAEQSVCDLAQIESGKLWKMEYPKLKKLAKQMGVVSTGTKEQIISRIEEHIAD